MNNDVLDYVNGNDVDNDAIDDENDNDIDNGAADETDKLLIMIEMLMTNDKMTSINIMMKGKVVGITCIKIPGRETNKQCTMHI